MPPRKKAKAKAPKKSKARKTVSHVQQVSVRVGGGGGGNIPAPIVYATYAPPPPTQPTQFVFDNGMPPGPVKRSTNSSQPNRGIGYSQVSF